MSSSIQASENAKRLKREQDALAAIQKRAIEMAPGTALAILEAEKDLNQMIEKLPLTKHDRELFEDLMFTLSYIYDNHGTQN